MRFSTQENILSNGSQIYQLDLLVDGDNASRLRLCRVLACHTFLVVLYNTSISSISPRHNFDQRRFASTVLADQCMNLTCLQFKIHSPEYWHAGKTFFYALH